MKRILVVQVLIVVAALVLVLVAVLGVRDSAPREVQDEMLLEMLGDQREMLDDEAEAVDAGEGVTTPLETVY